MKFMRRFISWKKGSIGVSLRSNQWFILFRKLLFTNIWSMVSPASSFMLVLARICSNNLVERLCMEEVKQEHLYNCLICVIWWIKTMIVSVYHKLLFRKSVIHCILLKLLMRKINSLKHAVHGAKIIAAKVSARQFILQICGATNGGPRVPKMADVCLCCICMKEIHWRMDKLFNI